MTGGFLTDSSFHRGRLNECEQQEMSTDELFLLLWGHADTVFISGWTKSIIWHLCPCIGSLEVSPLLSTQQKSHFSYIFCTPSKSFYFLECFLFDFGDTVFIWTVLSSLSTASLYFLMFSLGSCHTPCLSQWCRGDDIQEEGCAKAEQGWTVGSFIPLKYTKRNRGIRGLLATTGRMWVLKLHGEGPGASIMLLLYPCVFPLRSQTFQLILSRVKCL